MSNPKQDPEVHAVNTIVQSLRPLDAEAQQRVLQSSLALLGLAIATQSHSIMSSPSQTSISSTKASALDGKKKGLTELLLEKNPGTNAQRIVLFAYYRREVENIATFARQELKTYFAKARLSPPANFDRDFSRAVEAGWIHEDGENSYVTGSGDQLVDHGFQGERVYVPQPKGKKKQPRARGKRT
jgi:hypothetical protein